MNSQPYSNNVRYFSLSDEVEIGTKLIVHGLRALQDDDTYRSFFHLPMLLLANGFERLLKTIICFDSMAQQGVFPTKKSLQTHDVAELLERVTDSCYTPAVLACREATEDFNFLRNDRILREAIDALSAFGRTERYFNLDVVVGERGEGRSPEDSWALQIELALLEEHPEWAEELTHPGNTVSEKLAGSVVAAFEQLARALARRLVDAEFGEMAWANSTYVQDFLAIRDFGIQKW